MIKMYTAYDLDRDFDHLSIDYTNVESAVIHVPDDETDINQLVLRSRMRELTGQSDAFYGDCALAGADDYHSAMIMVSTAQESFEALPSSIRNRFHNDPFEFLSFIEDPANKEEAVNLGLLDPDVLAYAKPDINPDVKSEVKPETQPKADSVDANESLSK
ncbi:MAG: internal scaffolding protein [Microviridae sp.]|nr:MAG: internal scaffolding protein [Microviridae sp.]